MVRLEKEAGASFRMDPQVQKEAGEGGGPGGEKDKSFFQDGASRAGGC